MTPTLRLLLIEDSSDAAALVVCSPAQGGYEVAVERVDTPAALIAALERAPFDIAIADADAPAFAGTSALELVRQRDADLPFIVVSRAAGDEAAVAAMRTGAHDYILKDNLARLVPAVERELRDATNRRASPPSGDSSILLP